MSSVVKTIFGGTDDSAQKAQIDANKSTAELIAKQAKEAEQAIIPLFSQAQEQRNLGFQGAADVFGQGAPAQISAFQQGNVGAQQALLAGLPQIQNAILGRQVDLTGLQPQQINVDTGFLQQQLPQFQSGSDAMRADLAGQQQSEGAQSAQTEQIIRQGFIDVLGREPDPSGLAFYTNVVAPGGLASPGGQAEFLKSISGSAEAKQFAASRAAPIPSPLGGLQ